MRCDRLSLLLILPLLLASWDAACYGQPMDGTMSLNRDLTSPIPASARTDGLKPASNGPEAGRTPEARRAAGRSQEALFAIRGPRTPPHRVPASSPTFSLSPRFVEAMRPYVADAPLTRMYLPPPAKTNGRPRPPEQSAQQANGNVRLYVLIGAAVLVAGWVSYAVLARSESEGIPPKPPPRPQPQ